MIVDDWWWIPRMGERVRLSHDTEDECDHGVIIGLFGDPVETVDIRYDGGDYDTLSVAEVVREAGVSVNEGENE